MLKIKIYERDKSIYKDARKRHGRDEEMNILHCYVRDSLKHYQKGPEVKVGEIVGNKAKG